MGKTIKKLTFSPVALFFWTLVVLMAPNVGLAITEEMTWLPVLVQIILPLSFYALVLSLSKSTGKMVWWLFLFIFFAAFQIVLLFLFGNSIIGVDMFLNVLTTNPAEAFEVLGNLLTGIATVVLFYVPILVVATIQIIKKTYMARGTMLRYRYYSLAGLSLGLVLLVCAAKFTQGYRVLCDLYPVNVIYNVKLTADRLYATAHYSETSAGFTYNAKAGHTDDGVAEVYIIAVGETERADHFQHYGYARHTTPRLVAEDSCAVWFDDVLSQSNTTHKSVPMLLSAASAENYDRIYKEKSVITAFKEAGFHTAYLSNQRRNHSFIDTFGEEADEVEFLKDDTEEHYDKELLSRTQKLIASGHKKLLLVVHLYGSHFVYRERYQRDNAVFLPDDATEARAANKESLVNAYDNTILEEDIVLDSIFRQAVYCGGRVAMLYTSDHGENIYDDSRELFLHASPRASYYDLHVPFVILLSPSYSSLYSDNAQALKDNSCKPVSSNLVVFHTMLGLAGISTPLYNDSLSLASPTYECSARFYLNDHNEPVSLLKLKLAKEDLDMFKKHGITYK